MMSWAAFTTVFAGLRPPLPSLQHRHRVTRRSRDGGAAWVGEAAASSCGRDRVRGGGCARVDELALLLNLEDVYWAYDGRKSVDAAVGVIAVGATVFAGLPFWPP